MLKHLLILISGVLIGLILFKSCPERDHSVKTKEIQSGHDSIKAKYSRSNDSLSKEIAELKVQAKTSEAAYNAAKKRLIQSSANTTTTATPDSVEIEYPCTEIILLADSLVTDLKQVIQVQDEQISLKDVHIHQQDSLFNLSQVQALELAKALHKAERKAKRRTALLRIGGAILIGSLTYSALK